MLETAINDGLDTNAAREYLREEHKIEHTAGYLVTLRSIGGGPAFCRHGRAVRYFPSDLDAYAKARIRGPFRLASAPPEVRLNHPAAAPAGGK